MKIKFRNQSKMDIISLDPPKYPQPGLEKLGPLEGLPQTHRDLIHKMVLELTCVIFWLGTVFSSFLLIEELYIPHKTQNSKTNCWKL